MPIKLNQLSRREFLKRAAWVGAGLALAPSAVAGLFGKGRDPHTFALLSDTHIAAEPLLMLRGHTMAANLAAVVREVAALPQSPAHILVNGDLALKLGLAEEYATFARVTAPLRAVASLHLSLGNHDQRQNFWKAFPHDARQQPVPDRQVAVIPAARANWFMVDSLDKTDSTPGELGEVQLAWLDRELTAHADKPAVLVCHHNLNTGEKNIGLKVKDSAAMESLFARHRQVKAFIYGHTHDWHVTQHASGVHLVNLPPVGYPFKADRPCGWVRATLVADGMELELRSLDVNHPEHGKVQALKWRARGSVECSVFSF